MAKRRRTGGRGVARNVFALLWIGLAGLSGFYLFTLFTDPTALGGPAMQMSAVTSAPAPSAPAAAPAAPAPAPAAAVDSAEINSLEGNIQNLSQQLAQLDARLKPIEKFIGPVAALPPAASVSTSAPAPAAVPAPAAAPPEPVAAAPEPEPTPEPEVVEEDVVEEDVVEETVAEAAPPPPPPVAVASEPEPEPEPEPAVEPEPEPETPAAVAEAEPAAPPAQEEVEIATFDPVTLPPSANDGSTRYGIEIGVVGKRDELRPLWREYLTKHAALVAGLQPRRVLAPDNKWRLIAGPFANAQDAEGACSLFKKADRPCAATVYAGDSL